MTAQQLREKFNRDYELNPWPKTFIVDPETYLNVCVFTFGEKTRFAEKLGEVYEIKIHLGPHRGLMFMGVELLKEVDKDWVVK